MDSVLVTKYFAEALLTVKSRLLVITHKSLLSSLPEIFVMMFILYVLLQLSCVSAHSIELLSATFTSTFPNSQVSVGHGYDCVSRTIIVSEFPSISFGCADIWWNSTISVDSNVDISETIASTTSSCFSSLRLTWAYDSAITHTFTVPFESSSGTAMRTVTVVSPHTITETLSTVAAPQSAIEPPSEVTLTESTDGSSKIVIGPAIMETLTIRTLSAVMITETHTHSAKFMLILNSTYLAF